MDIIDGGQGPIYNVPRIIDWRTLIHIIDGGTGIHNSMDIIDEGKGHPSIMSAEL
jgi:hypothetical protein